MSYEPHDPETGAFLILMIILIFVAAIIAVGLSKVL